MEAFWNSKKYYQVLQHTLSFADGRSLLALSQTNRHMLSVVDKENRLWEQRSREEVKENKNQLAAALNRIPTIAKLDLPKPRIAFAKAIQKVMKEEKAEQKRAEAGARMEARERSCKNCIGRVLYCIIEPIPCLLVPAMLVALSIFAYLTMVDGASMTMWPVFVLLICVTVTLAIFFCTLGSYRFRRAASATVLHDVIDVISEDDMRAHAWYCAAFCLWGVSLLLVTLCMAGTGAVNTYSDALAPFWLGAALMCFTPVMYRDGGKFSAWASLWCFLAPFVAFTITFASTAGVLSVVIPLWVIEGFILVLLGIQAHEDRDSTICARGVCIIVPFAIFKVLVALLLDYGSMQLLTWKGAFVALFVGQLARANRYLNT